MRKGLKLYQRFFISLILISESNFLCFYGKLDFIELFDDSINKINKITDQSDNLFFFKYQTHKVRFLSSLFTDFACKTNNLLIFGNELKVEMEGLRKSDYRSNFQIINETIEVPHIPSETLQFPAKKIRLCSKLIDIQNH